MNEPPRLAYLLKKFPRLSETFVLNEILAQERLGRHLHIFSRRTPDDEPKHPELARLSAKVETLPPVRSLDPWNILFGGARDPGLFERLDRVVESSNTWGHPRVPSLLAEALYLLGRTRELGVRHLHVHFASEAAVVALLLREIGGPSYSLTAHAKDIYRRTVNRPLLDVLIARSEFAVTVCDANVDYLAERLSSSAMSRVRRLYNGIDIDSFATAPAGTERRDPSHILAVGRLVEKKGFHVLLEALEVLRPQRDFRATLVGDGEEREALNRRITELGLERQVRLTGPLDQNEVRELMARATVFCLPCLEGADGNRDALPTVLLEALAAGLPAVSTPISGIPEILDHGRAGRIVPTEDPAAIAGALDDLLGNTGLRHRLARAGRQRAAECFDLRTISRQLAGWFDQVLEPEAALSA